MDFFTTHAAPVSIKVNGTTYNLPRFLLSAMKEWAAERRQKVVDEATAHLKDDDKARFLMYFQSPYIDVFDIAAYANSPEGIADICNRQMKAGGVPDAERAAVLANADPSELRKLSAELASAKQAAGEANDMTVASEPGKSADPLQSQPGGSTDSPGAGPMSSSSSATSTAA